MLDVLLLPNVRMFKKTARGLQCYMPVLSTVQSN